MSELIEQRAAHRFHVPLATTLIVDVGMGNVGSIANMLRRLGVDSCISARTDDVDRADRIILPGVGTFDEAMRRLRQNDLVEALHRRVMVDGMPFLGICLGMQLLAEGSDEGDEPGLGWIPGRVRRLEPAGVPPLPVPHMGWNRVNPVRRSARLSSLADEHRYYFVHSYAVDCVEEGDILGRTTYGTTFVSAVERANVAAVQFHPEKSHRHGIRLLADFVA